MNEDLIGVSVAVNGQNHILRFHISNKYLKELDDPERLEVRGQAANGFIIAPSRTGLKISKGALTSGGYLQTTLNNFELSKKPRKRFDVRPEIMDGQIRIGPMPPAWIDAAAEFSPDENPGPTKLHRPPAANGGVPPHQPQPPPPPLPPPPPPNGAASPTVPPPKPTLAYAVPNSATMMEMQAELAARLNDAKAIIKTMEDRTGMKFVLDRNLRLVVAL